MNSNGILCAAAGRLHVNVSGKPVVPGGHPLVAAASEMSSLAFVAEHIACRAGQPSTALLQLQDAHGNNLQAWHEFPLVSREPMGD